MTNLTLIEYIILTLIMAKPLWIAIFITTTAYAIYETWSLKKESKIAYMEDKESQKRKMEMEKKDYILSVYKQREAIERFKQNI